MSEILRPGYSRSNTDQPYGRQTGYLDKATLESGQLAVAKLELESFAGGEGVGQPKVLQVGGETDAEPGGRAEQQGEVEPGSVVSHQDYTLLLLEG